MIRSRHFAFLLVFVLPATAAAADLRKIDRTITKEPVYQSKAPKYCLLVFGPEAKTRVWLVQDGETLYVDRNGNGDLTEAGEKVRAKKGDATDAAEGVFYFEAGDIQDEKLLHKNLRLTISKLDHLADRNIEFNAYLKLNPKTRGHSLSLDVEIPGWHGTGVGGRVDHHVSYADVRGLLRFADKAGDAPVIHFGGPWHITLWGAHTLATGWQDDVLLALGTPGLGSGTTAFVDYEGVVPKNVYPTISITYPSREGEPPIKELRELKDRC